MTKKQAIFAKQHDWFRLAVNTKASGFAVIVEDNGTKEVTCFTSFYDMCKWAGYIMLGYSNEYI
jgi:hypothetical protein